MAASHSQRFCRSFSTSPREAAARTQDAVCDAIGHILDIVTANECANYFLEAGYASA